MNNKKTRRTDESDFARDAWYVCKPGSVGDDRNRPCPLSIWDDCCQHASSHLRRSAGPTVYPKVQDAYGVAPDRVYICTQLPAMPVSFYLAFPSVPREFPLSESTRNPGSHKDFGSLFLLHFPGSYLRRTLSVILPCGARTFLIPIPFGTMARNGQAYPAVFSIHEICRFVKGRLQGWRSTNCFGRAELTSKLLPVKQ